MTKKLSSILIFLIIDSFLFSNFLFAGNIDSGLALKLASFDNSQTQSVLVVLKEQADLPQLNFKLSQSNADLRQRHFQVINTLQTKASLSQKVFLDFLENEKREGKVKDYKSFWITNAVWVNAPKEVIENISKFPEVEIIYEDFPVELIKPITCEIEQSGPIQVEDNLKAVGVREAWSLGYTGAGRLVCNFDTGVEGDHPALASRFRGNNGESISATWFDPYGSFAPTDENGHGTHTMGIIAGISENDTIGVAFEAQWMAAAVVDRGISLNKTISDILSAFQWAVDPDLDPNTIYDVPDVINNSWGIPYPVGNPCAQTFWNAIDNVEAAGVVCIFAAGNEGPDSMTLRNPASRASSPYNTFSVGAVSSNSPFTIASFSSRGPSSCDSVSKKPELVAPGVNIRSSYVGKDYKVISGTSMAAPHVSGAVAILRQYNPNATVEQIKQALIQSCTDLGPAGEDNDYGSGLVNIRKALDFLPVPTSPNLILKKYSIYDSTGGTPKAGFNANLIISLVNSGISGEGISAVISCTDSLVEIISNICLFGAMSHNEEKENINSPFVIRFSPSCPSGKICKFLVHLSGNGFSQDIPLAIQAGSTPDMAEHNVGSFIFSISNFSQYGLGSNSFSPFGGKGLVYPKNSRDKLYEAGFLAGIAPDKVLDDLRNSTAKSSNHDFEAEDSVELKMLSPGSHSDQESFAIFSDKKAPAPLGLKVIQKSYAYANPPNDKFLILEYFAKNTKSSLLASVYLGLFFDWDVSKGTSSDKIGIDTMLSLIYQFDPDSNIFIGLVSLTHQAFTLKPIDNASSLYDGFSRLEKFQFLSSGIPLSVDNNVKDWSSLISCGPFDIPAEDSIKVAFAVVMGDSLAELLNNARAAKIKYQDLATEVKDDLTQKPSEFWLGQNYPNPFNSNTVISYSVPEENPSSHSEKIYLKVYNILGQEVKTLVDETKPIGKYQIIWDGSDELGRKVPSGIYLYRLQIGEKSFSKKMVLLK
jgi:subtilisin family serine protease